MNFGTEFWAALLGAIVGGLISGVLQYLAFRREDGIREKEKLDANKTIAASLMYKMMRFVSDLSGFDEHFNNEQDVIEGGEPWSYVNHVVNIPAPIVINSDEMSCVLKKNNDALSNKMFYVNTIHGMYLSIIAEYNDVKRKLGDMVPNSNFEGEIATSELSKENYLKIRPFMIQGNQLVNSIKSRINEDKIKYIEALFDLNIFLKSEYKIDFTIERTKSPNSVSKPASISKSAR